MSPKNCSCFVPTLVLCLLSMAPVKVTFSQNQRVIDSLLTVLPDRSGAEKYAVYHWLTAEYADWDNDKAFEFAKRAEEAAYEVSDSMLIIKSQRVKGQILFRLGRPQDVILLLGPIASDSFTRNRSPEYLSILNVIGSSHVIMSQYDRGLALYFQTYESAKRQGDQEHLAISLENIGVTYYKLKDYRKALSYLLRSLTVREGLKNATYLSSMNISLCYAHLGDIVHARKYLQESIETCGTKCPSRAMVHIQYASGLIHYRAGQFEDAARDFRRSLQLSKEVEDSRLVLDNIYLLAKIYLHSSKLTEAQRLLKEGEDIIEKGIPYNLEMIKVYEELSEVYREMKQFEKASFYQTKYIVLKDSIYNEALTTNLMKVESQYLEHENKSTIAAQKHDIISKEQVIQRQLIFNLMAGSLVIMSLVVLVLLFRGYRAKKANNQLLEKKVMERTSQLEHLVAEMERKILENTLEHQKMLESISRATKSLQGLCNAGSHEIFDELSRTYFQRIQTILTGLNKIGHRIDARSSLF